MAEFVCGCDYQTYGAHSNACHDQEVAHLTRQAQERRNARDAAEKQRVAELEAENALLRERLADVKFALRDQHFGSYASLYRGVWTALNNKDWDWSKP